MELDLIKRGAVEIIPEAGLKGKLQQAKKEKRPLRIKAGFDPSAPDIHLGHTVLLRKLRHFQELGHKVVFLIGDCTAMIGDPSGQSEMRKPLTRKEVEANSTTYVKQVSKILDTKDKKVFELRFNSEWFGSPGENIFGLDSILELTSRYTVARLLERDDFLKRYKAGKPISMVEFLYPLMQGYDSVKLKADIELGGTDQKFNLIVGRDLQGSYGQKEQVVITMPLLEGTDGVAKMSKSLNNHIGINEAPDSMFGKIMSVSDEMMWKYYELLTDEDLKKVKAAHPMQAKKDLAQQIVAQYHGKTKAQAAQKDFEKKFQKKDPFINMKTKEIKTDVGFVDGKLPLIFLLCDIIECVKSKAEFKRLIAQGAIKINGKTISDLDCKLELNKEQCIKVGKLRFFKIRISRSHKKLG